MRVLLLALLLVSANVVIADNLPKSAPAMLVEPSALVEHLEGKSPIGKGEVILVDVRSEDAFAKEHLPGARNVDAAKWKAAFGEGTDTAAWSKRIAEALVTYKEGSTVVVYDEQFTPTAARIWWILKYWGVGDVRVLDGGLAAWKAAGGEATDALTAAAATPAEFTAKPHPERLVTFREMQEILGEGDSETCLVDTRSDEENTAGYIPSAAHLDWQELVDPKTGKLRSKKELQELLALVEFDPAMPTVTYCRSGGRASVMAFAMELVSGKPVANYHGSWSEWTRRGGAQAVDPSNLGR